MFYTTDLSVTLWILNQNKKGGEWHGRTLRNREGEILFVDLRTWNENVHEKKYVELKDYQIQKYATYIILGRLLFQRVEAIRTVKNGRATIASLNCIMLHPRMRSWRKVVVLCQVAT